MTILKNELINFYSKIFIFNHLMVYNIYTQQPHQQKNHQNNHQQIYKQNHQQNEKQNHQKNYQQKNHQQNNIDWKQQLLLIMIKYIHQMM